MKQQCEDDIHDWEYSSWGVIIGVSKCRKCGKVAKGNGWTHKGAPIQNKDFDLYDDKNCYKSLEEEFKYVKQ